MEEIDEFRKAFELLMASEQLWPTFDEEQKSAVVEYAYARSKQTERIRTGDPKLMSVERHLPLIVSSTADTELSAFRMATLIPNEEFFGRIREMADFIALLRTFEPVVDRPR